MAPRVKEKILIKSKKAKHSAKDFLLSSKWVYSIYWRISKGYLIVLIVTSLVSGAQGTAISYIFAKLIDALVDIASRDIKTIDSLLPLVFLVVIVNTFFILVRSIKNFVSNQLNFLSDIKMRVFLYEKIQSLEISTLEEPEVNNLITRSRENIFLLPRYLNATTRLIGFLSSLTISTAVVLNFEPLIALGIIAFSIPALIVDRKYLSQIWVFGKSITEERRSAFASLNKLLSAIALQELRISQGVTYLVNKFDVFFKRWYKERHNLFRNWYVNSFIFDIFPYIAGIAGYLVVFSRFLGGKITIGTVGFYISAVDRMGGHITSTANTLSNIYEQTQKINEVREFFEMKDIVKDGKKVMKEMKHGPKVAIQNLSFSYPNTKKRVLKNINLEIKPGEKVAIVGANGAGKTTLVKLITRFYRASTGSVLINGINVNEYKIDSLYKNTSVLFQDYNTYEHLTAKENIHMGKAKGKQNIAKIVKAAKRADAHDFIRVFKDKYDQVLSEKYKGGIRPSTGQWQKIAIARFFYRNAPLVIFDEPTAAIDAVSEEKIFNKIYKSFKTKTVIIISHRFSTVRHANRIIVIDKGRVAEHGSHKELMAINGKYAKAFNLQAKGYQ